MKTTLERAKELLESQSAKSIEKTVEAAIGWAIVAVAEQLDRVATIAETWAKQPK